MSQSEYAKSILRKADIIHLQRVLLTNTHSYIQYWRSQGKAVVADWDDAYQLIHPTNAAAKFWLHGTVSVRLESGIEYDSVMPEHPLSQFKNGLKYCTAGITPGMVLSDDWSLDTPVFHVPNYLDTKLYRAAPKHNNDPYVVLGWGGSLSHTESWEDSGIQEAMKRVLQDRDNVRLLIVGDERIIKQLPVRKDKLWFSPYTSWSHWQKTLMRYDIGLAPLAGDYDDRRSNLKVAEYLMAGLPFVASRSPVYKDFFDADSGYFVEHGHDKERYDDRVEDWYLRTIDVIDNIVHYRDLARVSIDRHGMRYDVDANVQNIVDVYKRIIALEK